MKIKYKPALAEKAAEFAGNVLVAVIVGFLLFSALGGFEDIIASIRWER